MTVMVALVVLLLVAFPTTRLGKGLRSALVERPAQWLNGMTTGRFLFYLALSGGGLTLFCLFEVEGLRLFGMLAPELLVWFAFFDVAIFVDVLILSISLAATGKMRAVRAHVVQRLKGISQTFNVRKRGRQRGIRITRIRPTKAPIDDPEPVFSGLVPA
jgi:hypothetical protein